MTDTIYAPAVDEMNVASMLNDWIQNDVDDYDKIAIEAYTMYYGTPETVDELGALQNWVGRGCYDYYSDGEEEDFNESDGLKYEYIAYSELLGGSFYGYVVWKD